MSKYTFDKRNLNPQKDGFTFGKFVKGFLAFFFSTLFLSLVYYVIIALVFNTPVETRLSRQNRVYKEQIPQLEAKEALLSDVVKSLQLRDDEIYNAIFHTDAPDIDPTTSLPLMHDIDSVPDSKIVSYTKYRIDSAFDMAERTENNFREIMSLISDNRTLLPPLVPPLRDLNYAQVSASIGEKINPFYKVPVMHNGLDIIENADVPVYCTCDGVVTGVVRSRKGQGNCLTVTHAGGYKTVYAHLAQIDVPKGRRIRRGSVIGKVGMSGNSYAPHLHYEVYKDSTLIDPVNTFFAAVSPEEYVNMLVMSLSTRQSMD